MTKINTVEGTLYQDGKILYVETKIQDQFFAIPLEAEDVVEVKNGNDTLLQGIFKEKNQEFAQVGKSLYMGMNIIVQRQKPTIADAFFAQKKQDQEKLKKAKATLENN